MWPLLLCSILSLTLIIERTIYWVKERRKRDGQVIEEILHLAEAGNFEKAIELSNRSFDVGGRVLMEGLRGRDYGVRESLEIAARTEIDRMKWGMTVLDTIITLAPLLGILGTVLGIIESFDVLGKMGIENPRAVTGGIAQALITTAAGLFVAIMTLIPFNIFVNKVEHTTGYLEKITTGLEIACRKHREGEVAVKERL
jgi:biopolymer transport protein ExbB